MEHIIDKIARDMAELSKGNTFQTQWPISAVEASYYITRTLAPRLESYISFILDYSAEELVQKKIFSNKVAQTMLMLLPMDTLEIIGKNSFRENFTNLLKILEKLRKEPTFTSLETNYPIINLQNEFNSAEDVRDIIGLLEALTEIFHPVYRGYGYEIYSEEEKIIRIYYDLRELSFDSVVIEENVEEKPTLSFFGHVFFPEKRVSGKMAFFKDKKNIELEPKKAKEEIAYFFDHFHLAENERKYVVESVFRGLGLNLSEKNRKALEADIPFNVAEYFEKIKRTPKERMYNATKQQLEEILL